MSRDRSDHVLSDSRQAESEASESSGKPERSAFMTDTAQSGTSSIGMKTRAHILAISEDLFARDGYDRVSVRNIASAADVNIASINYHFGSKQRLFEALFEMRASEITKARLEQLEKALDTQGSQAERVRAVVDAFVRPALSLVDPDARGGRGKVVLQFLNRAFGMADEEIFLDRYYGEVRSKFVKALCDLLPEIKPEDILYRYNLMVGALIFAMAGPERMFRVPEGIKIKVANPNDTEAFIKRFVDFYVAGILSH